MADGIVTLPRAGTVEVIQEFGGGVAAPARPILSPCVIGSAFQIVAQEFAGYYQGRVAVADELVGTGDNVETEFQLDNVPVVTSTVELHVGTISGTLLVLTTDYTVTTAGLITLTGAGVTALGTNDLHAKYSYAPAQTYVYPEIKQGATVEAPSTETKVFLKTAEDIFDLSSGFGLTLGATSVTLPGDIQPSRSVTVEHGQMEILVATDTIEDGSLDFFALGVKPGDVLKFITQSVNLEYTDSIVSTDSQEHVVLSVPNLNTVTISPNVAAQGGKVEYEIIRKGSQTGEVLVTYRARRADKEGLLLEYSSVTDLETDLGPIQPDNPLPYALSKVLGATDKTTFGVMVKDQDALVDHQKALDFLEGEEVYLLVPLTRSKAIHQVYVAHCEAMSLPTQMRERRVLVSPEAVTRDVFQASSNTGAMTVGSTLFTDASAEFLQNNVPVGAVIRLTSPASIELADVARTELIIASIVSDTQVNVIQAVTQGTLKTDQAAGTGDGVETQFQLPDTENVIPASVIVYFDDVQQSQAGYSTDAAGLITFTVAPGSGVVITADYEITTISGITYTVESQEKTNHQIAQDIGAFGSGYGSRRVTVTQAHKVVVEDGTEQEPYFLNAALAGLVSTLAPNQPIANIPVPGFQAIKHLRRFTEEHFGIMAAKGVSVFIQDRDTAPVVLRNWLTTDVTNVNTRENSIVQMADYYAKFLRNNVQSIAGKFNITESFIDDMLRPAINGVIREMITAGFAGTRTKIVSIEQSTVQKDQVLVVQDLELFAPANRITITVRIL